ncbi:MAG: ABC transporter ATP-binding protein [Gemmatimonadaceae bacterium]|jgi:Cu-processing system ATP-binding protein|nr:ABC transporter ATP-binding protein [Gemmatimonadaceae bacterium]
MIAEMMSDGVRLAARGVHKAFGAVRVLEGVHLALRAGRVTAVLGPNGSGKTTLNKVLLGLVRADAGAIMLDGRVVTGTDAYRRRIGYMPQAPRFPDNLSAREVLTLVQSLRPTEPVDLDASIQRFDIATYVDRPLGVCSGGQRQRVNAAVALLFSPDVLILDEPTAGLDPVASAALKDRIAIERAAGRAILVTSHVLSELDGLTDDVVLLLDGRVQYEGSIDALREVTSERTLERAVAALLRADRAGASRMVTTGEAP